MKNKKVLIKKVLWRRKRLLFEMAFYLFFIYQIVLSTQFGIYVLPESMRFIVFGLDIILLVSALVIDEAFKRTDFFVYLLLVAAFCAMILGSGDIRREILFALLLATSRYVDFDDFFPKLFYLLLISVTTIVLLDYIGAFKGISGYMYAGYRADGKIRLYNGFIFVTYVANYYFSLVLLWCFKEREKAFSPVKWAGMMILNYAIFYISDTRAVFIECMMVLCAFAIIRVSRHIRERKKIFGGKLWIFVYPMCAAVSIILSMNYDSQVAWQNQLNKVLSNRLDLSRRAIEEFGISFLGKRMNWRTSGFYGTSDYMYVDCSYMNMLIHYGIIALVLILLIMSIILYYAVCSNNLMLLLILAAIALHSCTDPQLFDLVYTPFLLMVGEAIRYIRNRRNQMNKRIVRLSY